MSAYRRLTLSLTALLLAMTATARADLVFSTFGNSANPYDAAIGAEANGGLTLQTLGEAFFSSVPAYLDTIELVVTAATNSTGPFEVTVSVLTNGVTGAPDTTLDSRVFTLSPGTAPQLISVDFFSDWVMDPANDYWLVVAPSGNNSVIWHDTTDTTLTGRQATWDGSTWAVADTSTFGGLIPRAAFQVLGTDAVPEPSALFCVGLPLGLFFAGRTCFC